MRRLQLPARAGRASRLDGAETESTARIGWNASETPEAALEPLLLGVLGMRVLACCIGLPDFDHAVVHGGAIAVEQPSLDRDPLAPHPGPGDLRRDEPGEADVQIRPDRLVGARVEAHRPSASIGVASRPRSTMSKR